MDNVLDKLKLDLSIRKDNTHCGSGLGGNISEYFFLMTHDIKMIESEDNNSYFYRRGFNTIAFKVGKTIDLKQVRLELTKFLKTQEDYKEITDEQIKDLAFLNDYRSLTSDMKYFVSAIEEVNPLSKTLNEKAEFTKSIRELFDSERKSSMGLFYKLNPISDPKFFAKEKFFKTKIDNDHNEREATILKNLISQFELETITNIGKLPNYISAFIVRTFITLETMIRLDLDLLDEFSFMKDINNLLDYK